MIFILRCALRAFFSAQNFFTPHEHTFVPSKFICYLICNLILWVLLYKYFITCLLYKYNYLALTECRYYLIRYLGIILRDYLAKNYWKMGSRKQLMEVLMEVFNGKIDRKYKIKNFIDIV